MFIMLFKCNISHRRAGATEVWFKALHSKNTFFLVPNFNFPRFLSYFFWMNFIYFRNKIPGFKQNFIFPRSDLGTIGPTFWMRLQWRWLGLTFMDVSAETIGPGSFEPYLIFFIQLFKPMDPDLKPSLTRSSCLEDQIRIIWGPKTCEYHAWMFLF